MWWNLKGKWKKKIYSVAVWGRGYGRGEGKQSDFMVNVEISCVSQTEGRLRIKQGELGEESTADATDISVTTFNYR